MNLYIKNLFSDFDYVIVIYKTIKIYDLISKKYYGNIIEFQHAVNDVLIRYKYTNYKFIKLASVIDNNQLFYFAEIELS